MTEMHDAAQYTVKLAGCDGTTEFVITLTDPEAHAVRRVAALSRACSQFSCQPVLELTRGTAAAEGSTQ